MILGDKLRLFRKTAARKQYDNYVKALPKQLIVASKYRAKYLDVEHYIILNEHFSELSKWCIDNGLTLEENNAGTLCIWWEY